MSSSGRKPLIIKPFSNEILKDAIEIEFNCNQGGMVKFMCPLSMFIKIFTQKGIMMKVTKKDVENLMYDHLIETFSNLLSVLVFDEMKVGFHKGNQKYDECIVRLLIFEEICNEMGIWDEFSRRDEKLVDKFRTIKRALGKDGMEVVSRRIDSQKEEEAYLIYIIETYKEIVNLISS